MSPLAIAKQLEREILGGKIPPGTALSQSNLAARFGVSRIPIRDALAHLATRGLINAKPNQTATVLHMSQADIDEAYDLRIMLECDLIERAVAQMTAQHLKDIDYALERSGLEAYHDNWAAGDQMFHAALYAAANRPRQTAIIKQLRRACRSQIAAYKQLTINTEQWLADHRTLCNLCHAGDRTGARSCLETHLLNARDKLLNEITKQATQDQKLITSASVTTISSG